MGPDAVSCAHAGGADDDTVFELGSLTKTYNGLLVAEAAGRGELGLEEPVAELLPDGWGFAGGEPVTVSDLVRHRSGLPRLPPNMGLCYMATRFRDPYAAFDARRLRRAVGRTRPTPSPYEYSNYAVGLLGYLVGLRARTSWGDALEERILGPLDLQDTGTGLEHRLVQGTSARGRPVPPWRFDVLAAAGALRGSLADQIRWLRAWLRPPTTPLGQAMEAALAQAPTPSDVDVRLGWHVYTQRDTSLFWHNGGTAGSASFAGFERETGVAVALLCASATHDVVTGAGLQLLAGAVQARS